MKVKNTLTVLLAILGLMLIGLISAYGSASYRDYSKSSEQITIDQARNDLLSAIIEMQKDRTRIVLSRSELASGAVGPDLLAHSVDMLRRASETLVAVHNNAALTEIGTAVGKDVATLSVVAGDLAAAVASGDPDAMNQQRSTSIEQIDLVQERLLKVRQNLFDEVQNVDSTLISLRSIRNYVLAVNRVIQENRILISSDLQDAPSLRPDTARLVADRTRALQDADRVFLDMISSSDVMMVQQATKLFDVVQKVYEPAEADFLRALSTGEGMAAARLAWVTAGDEADRVIDTVLAFVFEQSQTHVKQLQTQSLAVLVRLVALFVAALVIVVLSIYLVTKHILQPLERIRNGMLDLASGKLVAGAKENFLLVEMQAMAEALRVFRVNALRRERMTKERMSLHAKIAEAHDLLQSEMRAAAKVQLAQMPEPGVVGQVRFSTFFAASNVVAGDLFDFLPLSEGRVGVFQVDVAGHGAAAGLVSVAAHIGARRALSGLKPDASLAKAIETLNAFWSPEMTYFTMVSIELDARTNNGRIVQAGHPNPVLMRKDGSITRLGHGGLPIGVMPDAEFEEIVFPFHAGDRLFVFSDGIYENMNESSEMFTEERFIRLLAGNAQSATDVVVEKVQKTLRDWCGSGVLSDDVSLVVAERI